MNRFSDFIRADYALTQVEPSLVTLAVESFRENTEVRGPWSDERARLALHLAVQHFDRRSLPEARVWALRALQDGPRPDAYCVLGDVSEEEKQYDDALHWYRCARAAEARLPRYPFADLISNIDARLAAIERSRMEHRPGLVIRKAHQYGELKPHVFGCMENPERLERFGKPVFQGGFVETLAQAAAFDVPFTYIDSDLHDDDVSVICRTYVDEDVTFIAWKSAYRVPAPRGHFILVHALPLFDPVVTLSASMVKKALDFEGSSPIEVNRASEHLLLAGLPGPAAVFTPSLGHRL